MSELEALLLGIVQGLTEFLPISSSGHLILVPWLQDYTFLIDNESFNKTFDVALHAGTLVAAIIYFRHEVVDLSRRPSSAASASARSRTRRDRRLGDRGRHGPRRDLRRARRRASSRTTLGEPWRSAIQLIVFGAVLGWADSTAASAANRHAAAFATGSGRRSRRSSRCSRARRARGSRSRWPATSASTGTAPPGSPSCC